MQQGEKVSKDEIFRGAFYFLSAYVSRSVWHSVTSTLISAVPLNFVVHLMCFNSLFWFNGLQALQSVQKKKPLKARIGEDQNKAKRRLSIGRTFVRWPET